MIKAFEAFSGYGSQALALKHCGVEFESVGIAEIDKYAVAAHESLHGYTKNYGDVSKLETCELPNMDLFTYSFPCQDISNAGKQKGFDKGSGTRSSLLWECERIIASKRPIFLMMENVKNLISKKNKPNFDKWLLTLESLGYNNYTKVINAKWCGIPQNRERVFCVSILKEFDDGSFEFEEDFDNGIRLKDILEDQVDEKYYIDVAKSEKLIRNYIKRYKKEPKAGIGAIRGRYPQNPTSGISGLPTEQMLEMNKNSTSNTLTTVQKDNVVVEKHLDAYTHTTRRVGNSNPSGKGMNGEVHDSRYLATTVTTNKGEGAKILEVQPNELNMIGMLDMKGNESIRRVYDKEGICLTISTCQGGHREPKVLEVDLINPNRHSSCMNSVLHTNGICRCLDTMQSGNREPKVLTETPLGDNKSSRTESTKGVAIGNYIYRIRKLTPKECFRLMGLSDEEIDKIQSTIINNKPISNLQQYKLAGNSIVKQCMAFLNNLPIKEAHNDN